MKNSIIYLLFLIFLIFSLTVDAQNYSIGIRGGISIPNLSAGSGNQNPVNTGYSSRIGPDAGIFAEFKISDHFSLQPMVEYSSQGGKKNGLQAFSTPASVITLFPPGQSPQYLYANFNSEAKLDYLMIPVLAKFGSNLNNSPWRIYIDAGPFVSFLLSAKSVTSGNSLIYADSKGQQPYPAPAQSFNDNQDIKDQLNTTNVGIEGNIGLTYRFGVHNVFIEGGGNLGFLNIQKGTQNGKNNTGAATAVIGYSYWF